MSSPIDISHNLTSMGRDMHQNNRILENIVGPNNKIGSPRKSIRGLTIKLLNKQSELETIKEGKLLNSLYLDKKNIKRIMFPRLKCSSIKLDSINTNYRERFSSMNNESEKKNALDYFDKDNDDSSI